MSLFNGFGLPDTYKLVAIYSEDIEASNCLARVVNRINGEGNDLKITSVSGKIAESIIEQGSGAGGLRPTGRSYLLLLGRRDEILSVFWLDGAESREELELISSYIISAYSGKAAKLAE